MHWELRYDKWEYFPKTQKWFASAEAESHLEHLACIGDAEKTEEDEILYYELKKNQKELSEKQNFKQLFLYFFI